MDEERKCGEALAAVRRTAWPAGASGRAAGTPRTVGVVVATSNTRRLIAELLFTLHRVLDADELGEIVVVDNVSTDGSRELLRALDRAGLIHLIANRVQRYHGPAVTQGVSWLAGRPHPPPYVWVLDSDVVVLRPDTLRDALATLERSHAAAVGQASGDPEYDRLLRENPSMLQPFSLLFDPALLWRPPIPPFLNYGAPAQALQVAADRRGLRLAPFPFVEGRYVLHVGRGTLRQIAESGDTRNQHHEWALTHREAHFAGLKDGPRLYADFRARFDAEVGELSPETLVAACTRSSASRARGPTRPS